MTTSNRNAIVEHRAFVDALSRKSLAVEEPHRDEHEEPRREYGPTTDTNVNTFAL